MEFPEILCSIYEESNAIGGWEQKERPAEEAGLISLLTISRNGMAKVAQLRHNLSQFALICKPQCCD